MLGVGGCVTLDQVPSWALRQEDDVVIALPDGARSESISLPATAAR